MKALATLAVLALLAGPAAAKPGDVISVTGAWTRPAASGLTDAGYLTVTNRGKTADRLLSASSPQAGKIEMMLSVMNGDISTMKPIGDGLELAPGQTVRFEPGGYHLMLEDLKHEQKLGGAMPVTLTFAKAGKVKAALTVAASAPK